MPQPMLRAKEPYNRAMPWLALLLLLVTTPTLAHGADAVEVDETQTRALVDSIRGRPLTVEQHDLLVSLGRDAVDALPEERLYIGWALVFAQRPDLGLPLVRAGLAELELGAANGLRTLLFAEAAGQDGVVRATLALLKRISPEGAARLAKSVRQPIGFARAQARAGRALKGLSSGELDLPFEAGDARRVVWWVSPPSPTGPAVLWLPDGGTAEGLPRACQDVTRLKEAAVLARAGHPVYLPGLRGCDGSDGTYRGSADAAKDLNALVAALRTREPGRELVLLGLESGGLLAVRVANDVEVDRVVAWQPSDPGEAQHLPLAVVEARDVATLPARPLFVALPYPALAQLMGRPVAPLETLPARERAARAAEVLAASASAHEDR